MPETLTLAFLLIPCLIVAIVFHEVAHGWVAYMLGDPTAKNKRRLTLNPIRHVDPIGTLAVPLALALLKGPIFGWAKPVPVRKDRLNNPRWGMVLVAAAGPGSNFIMALVAAILLGFVMPQGALFAVADAGIPVVFDNSGGAALLATGLFFFLLINIFIALFNLLPIPPFDGSHIVEGLLPRKLATSYGKLRGLGMALFFALIALTWFAPEIGVIEKLILPPVEWLSASYLQITSAIAS